MPSKHPLIVCARLGSDLGNELIRGEASMPAYVIYHQTEISDPEVPNNTVAQVVQVGYVIGERVLRPAMVGVAKGGPKVSDPDETS